MRKIKVTTPEVKEVSEKLLEAIATADHNERKSAARAAVFESANATKETPQPVTMKKIIEIQMGNGENETLIVDMKELENELDSTNRPGHQIHALEKAEANARNAFRLLIRYKEMHQTWEMDNAVLFASMWAEASKSLHQEKADGHRSKQITDKDVETMVYSMFPDEYRTQEIRRLRAKQTEKSLEHLVEMWSSKCRNLGLLVNKGR